MAYRELPEDLLRAVDPQDLRAYVLATGWCRAGFVGRHFAVFTHPADDLGQVLVPVNVLASDYGRRVGDAVLVLAEREGRPAQEILKDLLQADADVLRFRIVSPEASRGSLPLEEAIDLLEGAKRALLAVACSVVAPSRRYHPRLSRSEAQDMLAACRMGQTERGSFTVTVACPVEAVEGDPATAGHVPFVRKATQGVMTSAQRLLCAIDEGDPEAVERVADGEIALTANFCEALLSMQPPQDRSSLVISCAWAPSFPVAGGEKEIPREITFRGDHFPALERIYRRLRPEEEPQPDLFIGYVDTLSGEIGPDGLVQGQVTLRLLREDGPLWARVELSVEDYQIANKAHMTGGIVAVRGNLHRGRRVHRLTEATDFQHLTWEIRGQPGQSQASRKVKRGRPVQRLRRP